ncbi:TPA: hypothetical protein N0F65_006393 [Lagenidium giganteum]|uniref:Uncharacterized protein n=1 Tax=Lagenidium giganteum TaxID=4803 RepID=A0AAV2YNT4_9STRA|nr:TPA: hypothetical protein N0F65_006393 [Lagenidium giganteum]
MEEFDALLDDLVSPTYADKWASKDATALDLLIAGDVDGLRHLLALSPSMSVNARHPTSGRSLLHDAAAHGQKEIVKFLLQDTEADIFLRTMLGRCTALHLAVMNNHRAIVFLLLSHGADSLSRDRFGSTPMHYAKSISVAKLLLQYGGELTANNYKRKNALECILAELALIDDTDEEQQLHRIEFEKFLKWHGENEYKIKLAKLREHKKAIAAEHENDHLHHRHHHHHSILQHHLTPDHDLKQGTGAEHGSKSSSGKAKTSRNTINSKTPGQTKVNRRDPSNRSLHSNQSSMSG